MAALPLASTETPVRRLANPSRIVEDPKEYGRHRCRIEPMLRQEISARGILGSQQDFGEEREVAKNLGMLTMEELGQQVEEGSIATVILACSDHFGRLIGKRFDAEFFLESVVQNGSHACDYLFTTDMDMDPVPGYSFANWELGYGDFHLVPDFSSLRVASWLDRTAIVLCDAEDEKRQGPVEVAPRSILRQQLRKLEAQGLIAMACSELEHYAYKDSYEEANAKGYRDLQAVGWHIEDYHLLQGTRHEILNAPVRRNLRESGVPVESSKGEWGLGQHEINLRYCEALAMADRHSLYKQCVKETAEKLGMSVTFMAKPTADGAGSSCHVHLSLWRDGDSAFTGPGELGPIRCSDVMRWFLGGWIAHAPEMMVFYAPTVNAYTRYQTGSWAPTRLAWSYDNRTAGFRVVGHGQSLRIECRIPGADCNPYLVYAAALASGLAGIREKIEPPAIVEGDVYTHEKGVTLPGSLREAVEIFTQSAFAREAFGPRVVEHYTHFFRTEQDAYDRSVTDWERERYFERI